MNKRTILGLALSTASTLLFPATAWSQDGTQSTSPSEAQQNGQDTGVGDIIVTAQRRAENLQKSSLSISVITPEQIGRQGVARTEDISRVSPGVQIGTAGPTPQIYIRGVGDPGNEPDDAGEDCREHDR